MAEVITAVKNGDADIGVAAISITAERERLVDFSQPFYESGLSILVTAQGQSSLAAIGKSLFTPDFVKQQVVGGLFQRQNYGIAVPQGSPHRKAINEALLKLRETGVLDELNTEWFGKPD